MNDEIQKQLLARLDTLAGKLGVAASALWQMYVRQAKINGYECLFGACIGFGLAAFLWVVGIGIMRSAKENKKEDDAECMWCFIPAIILIILGCVLGFNAIDLIANPQLWAFKSIVDAVK